MHCAVDSPHDAWLCDVRCAEFEADGGMQEVEWMVVGDGYWMRFQ